MAQAPPPHRTRTVLLGIALPAVLLVTAVLVVLSWRDRMPPEVAVHWGPNGVDRTGSLSELIAVPLVLGGVSWLIVSILCLTAARIALTRRLLVGVSAGMGALFAGIVLSSAAVQLDVIDPAAAADPAIGMAVTVVAALVIGFGAGALAGDDPPQPSTAPVPADAPRSALPTSAFWAGEARTTRVWPIWLATAVLLGLGVWFASATGHWWPVAFVVVVGTLPLSLLRWRVRIDHRGLTVAAQAGWPREQIPANEVVRADVVQVSPFQEFGGWGLRAAGDGRTGVVTRAGEAIQVQRSGDRVFVVTIDGAAEVAALLNTIAERSREASAAGGH
ncbi:DUF1648 domain-containing protein [Ruania zhangjianzhongii]|uniref:DUF1648 domain-containing protein n=1 Tax=Ruania zhangjianzhongii TaxID=2603206 RepID=UPI00143CC4AA|nr:DUF1648 domain-containing protein [Ruania zhangjianzhongii]